MQKYHFQQFWNTIYIDDVSTTYISYIVDAWHKIYAVCAL